MKGFNVTAPFLSDAERKEAATGYDGPAADTGKLLGKWDPKEGRRFQLSPVFGALQHQVLYVRPPQHVVDERRKKGRHARRARAGNTARIQRANRSNKPSRGYTFRRGNVLPVIAFLAGA